MENFQNRVSQNFPYKLSLSKDVENAYFTYETSFETENLESEEKRAIYGELIDCDWGNDWNRKYIEISKLSSFNSTPKKSAVVISIDDDDDGNKQSKVNAEKSKFWWKKVKEIKRNQPRTLKEFALQKLIKNFKSGKFDERIICQDAIDFAYLADIKLPFNETLLEFDNEIYWKRFVASKTRDFVKLEELFRSKKTDWKSIAVELIYAEYVESLKATYFPSTHEKYEKFTRQFAKYIRELKINKIQPQTKEICNEFDKSIKIVNYKQKDCEHFPLDFFRELKNLEKLSISFHPPELKKNYNRRFFNVAIEDIKNLSIGLSSLEKLHTLEITQTNLENDEKIKFLLETLQNLKNLKCLSLTHCNIKSQNSGGYFEKFLENSSLEVLDLSHNELDFGFCQQFAKGLENLKQMLKLSLIMTGIFYNGLDEILKSISKCDKICELNISSCESEKFDNENTVINELKNLLENSTNLKVLEMPNNEIKDVIKRCEIIEALEKNFTLESMDVFNCGFTTKEELKVKILILRNVYYIKNPLLKKESFTEADEVEIINWLKRVKHPLILKYQEKFKFVPTEKFVKWKNEEARKKLCKEPIENYENYVVSNK
ncbi:hypothetical protein PVAND_012336 [Polypedilum vanderplanki]|uniref:Uncharacterized protein n=1 Tax=Polypedilum vanderplanki TaxID=319348 RepID=A0A9J6CL97_POLVA|nr:hypothetical protein PVAND_012336 [Polypedilum vanderplanki]